MSIVKNLIQQVRALLKREMGVDLPVTDRMTNDINLWTRMYQDDAPWLSETVQSLNLPAAIASEVARLVTLEMRSELTGSARADYLQEQYARFLHGIRDYVEFAAAKGGIVFKPYVIDDRIAVDCVQADMFTPVAFDAAGNMTAAVFIEELIRGKSIYRRLEYHELNGTRYVIRNKAYVTQNADSSLGKAISLADVDVWADLAEELTVEAVERTLFAYYKMPIANNGDPRSPLGVSVYARAWRQIMEADKQWSRFNWEFEGSELAVDASSDLFRKDPNDKPRLPKGKERLFRTIEFDADRAGGDGMGLKTFSPTIRDESLANGLDKQLRRVEFNCSLSYGTLSDINTVEKTAEEIKTSKQRSYTMVCDAQKALENALGHLIYAMDVWAGVYHLAPGGSYQATCEWGDGILVDADKDQATWMREVAGGLMTGIEYRMRRYGETEEQAKARLPLITGPTV